MRVVLVEPKYDGNVGHVARVMKNFGVKELYLVRPRAELTEVAIARAMHALDVLEKAVIVNTLEEALENVEVAVGTTAIEGSTPIRNPLPPWEVRKLLSGHGKVALVFGPEDRGLRNWELEMCDVTMKIPTSEEYPSMNLSHAVAITLYEMTKGEFEVNTYGRPATKAEKEALVEALDGLTKALNMDPTRRFYARATLRRFLARARCTDKEIKTLIGIFEKSRKLLEGWRRG